MCKLKNKKLFLLDMDGTIYLGNNLFDGTRDFLEYVKSIGGKYIFLTNNSSKSVEKYILKLEKMGIKTTENDYYTSIDATAYYLKKKNYNKIYVMGTASFKTQLIEQGLHITDNLEEGIDCICIGFDTELVYKKLEDACILLKENIDYVATNPDYVCPTEFGYIPDCGSICDMLCNATEKRPKFIGKPQPDMVELAVSKSGFKKEETIIIGDRIYTDIAAGFNAGVETALVLSGESNFDTIKQSKIKPDFVFNDIKEFYTKLNMGNNN